MSEFALDLSKFVNLTKGKMAVVVKKSFIQLSSEIIETSPVDTGRFRANWLPAVNGYRIDTIESTDETKAIAKVVSTVNKYKLGDSVTLSNNLPYSTAIEFGLFRGEGAKIVGGFSKKAPAGVVRVNIQRWQKYVDENARKAR